MRPRSSRAARRRRKRTRTATRIWSSGTRPASTAWRSPSAAVPATPCAATWARIRYSCPGRPDPDLHLTRGSGELPDGGATRSMQLGDPRGLAGHSDGGRRRRGGRPRRSREHLPDGRSRTRPCSRARTRSTAGSSNWRSSCSSTPLCSAGTPRPPKRWARPARWATWSAPPSSRTPTGRRRPRPTTTRSPPGRCWWNGSPHAGLGRRTPLTQRPRQAPAGAQNCLASVARLRMRLSAGPCRHRRWPGSAGRPPR